MNHPNICVVGGGIIGLSSAYILAINYPGCKITIMAEKLAPNTVSFGSVWVPNCVEGFSGPHDVKWIVSTFKMCLNVTQNHPELATDMGIDLNTGFHVFDAKQGIMEKYNEAFMKTVLNFQRVRDDDPLKLELVKKAKNFDKIFGRKNVEAEDLILYKYGFYVIDGGRYLPWLMNELKTMTAKKHIGKFEIIQEKVFNIEDVCKKGFDLVVNCSGLGARELAKDDKMVPIRGQYLLCKRPSRNSPFFGSFGTLVCPLIDVVLVGGIFQSGREDDMEDKRDTEDLIRRSSVVWPDVQNHILSVETAIRPGRLGGTRLDVELIQIKNFKKTVPLIHNYGHGPKGFMLHWGCAEEVYRLSKEYLLTSKL